MPPLPRALGLATAAASFFASSSAATTLYVDCGSGSDVSGDGTAAHPFLTPTRARDALRALQPLSAPATVLIQDGDCYPRNPASATAEGAVNYSLPVLLLEPRDSGSETAPITYAAAAPGANVRFVAGQSVPPSAWSQAPGFAAGIVQADLAALGVADYGYGDIRPGGLGECAAERMELFYNGAPMTLARYPNILPNGTWAYNFIGSVANSMTTFTAPDPDGRMAKWASEEEPWAHGFWSFDWADSFVPISSITDSGGNATFSVPANSPPLYGFLPQARFYGVNLLQELDVPGEYFFSRANNTLYFYPPTPIADGEVILSMADYGILGTTSNSVTTSSDDTSSSSSSTAAPNPIEAQRGARAMRTPIDLAHGGPVRFVPRAGDGSTLSFVTISGIAVQFTRFAGVAIPSAANVTLVDVSASNHGQNGLNVAGVGILVSNVTVTGTGCAASSVYGGDEVHLVSGGNTVLNSEFGFYARWTRTYNPGIGWGGVGDVYSNNMIHNAPHNGMLGGGNNCVFSGNTFAHLCYAVDDSGAWYAGRSWVRRGQVLFNNSFVDIQNHEEMRLGYPSVQAIYLDDQLSGTSIIGNTFNDVQKGAFVGGGRDTIVDGNTCINSGYCVHVDNRGMNWQLEDCTKNATWTGQLVQDLFAVNYTQPPYATAYPPIVNSLTYHPCVPVNITVANNRFCNMSQGFIDVSSNDTTSWFDVVENNTEFTSC